jgi:hypothetical protein
MKETWRVAIIDLAASLLFVLMGLHAHHHGIGDVVAVWSPFAVGVLIGSAVMAQRKSAPLSVSSGLMLTAVTVACAMVLRALFSQGVVVVFVVVATVFLGLFFSSWRFVARRWVAKTGPSTN